MKRTYGPLVLGKHGAFAGCFRLDYNERLFKRNYRDPILVSCTDGVGTKVKLASQLKAYDTIGVDLVAMSINDLIVMGAEPLFFLDYLATHRLDPPIAAQIVKGVSDGCVQSGCALLGGETAEIAGAFIASREIFDLANLRRRINDLDHVVSADEQISMHLDLANFIRRQVLWFMRYYADGESVHELVSTYREPVMEISGRIEDMISRFEADYLQSRIQARVDQGMDENLARDVCVLDPLSSACDIADIAREFGCPVEETARAYSEMGELVGLPQLRAAAAQISAGEHFERLSVKRMIEDLFRQQRSLTQAVLGGVDIEGRVHLSGADAVDLWAQAHAGPVDRATTLVQEMESHGPMTAAKLALAASQVRDLALGAREHSPAMPGA